MHCSYAFGARKYIHGSVAVMQAFVKTCYLTTIEGEGEYIEQGKLFNA